MTRRRRLIPLLASLVCLVVLMLVLVALSRPASSKVTKENVEKIEVGLTLAEVEVIFGGPSVDSKPHTLFWRDGNDGGPILTWRGNGKSVMVHFDRDNMVRDFQLGDYEPQSFIERIRSWFPN